jgi:hypothetical protein
MSSTILRAIFRRFELWYFLHFQSDLAKEAERHITEDYFLVVPL